MLELTRNSRMEEWATPVEAVTQVVTKPPQEAKLTNINKVQTL